MIFESTVTIWHNNTAKHYQNVSLFHKKGIDKNGIKQTGFFDSSSCIIRIPAKSSIDISIGDYVRIGKHSGAHNRNTDFVIMQFDENLRGSVPHYKVVCER